MKRHFITCIAALMGVLCAQAENISIADVVMDPGETKTFAISLTNSNANLVSFQMDLYLPDGITINKSGCSLSSRFANGQELTIGKQADGVYRLTSTSFALTPISGTSGTIINLSLAASATAVTSSASIKDILFVDANSESVVVSDKTFQISVRENQSLSLATLPSQTYGSSYTLPSQTDQGVALTWTSASSSVATVSGNVLTAKGVGSTTVTATQAGNSSYLPFTKAYTLTVNKAPLTVTAQSYTITQGEPLPTFELTYSGFKNGETASVLATQPTITCSATSSSAPGTYDIVVSGGAATNYAFTYVKGTLTIEAVNIQFADNRVKLICVANWDTNGNGELSEAEAAAVTDLGKVFKGNAKITSFDELRNFTGLTYIGYDAFDGCTSLTSVTIPNSVTSLGSAAFYECSGLTSVTIPNSVISIGQNAFYGCSSLTSITIPNSVTSIGLGAFSACSSLISINVENGNTVYDSRNDCNAIIETSDNVLICGCNATIIPNSVTSIGGYAFFDCSGLTSIMIPNSVTSIGVGTFYDCTSLTSVTIPNSVTSIGSAAFRNCFGLTSLTIPNSVTSIGDNTFYGCSGLMNMTVEWETPINISPTVFDNSNQMNATLYVPLGCKAAYEADANWKEFKEIVEIDARSEQTLTLTEVPTMTYGDAAYALPQKTTEGLTLTWSVDNAAVANVSGNTLTIVGAGSATVTATQAGNDDYKPFSHEFTLTVNKAVLTITADDKTKQEGEENPELTVTYSGFVNGDDASSLTTQPTVSTTATTTSPAGTYPITASGAVSDNYEFTYVNGTLTVEERPEQTEVEVTDISQLENAIYIEPFTGRVGDELTVDVRLKNAEAVTSYGFELVLPEGMSIDVTPDGDFDDEVTLSTRHKGHSATTNRLTDGSYKVAVASMSSKSLTDNDGVVLTITAHVADNMTVGDYPVIVRNPLIVFSGADATKPVVQPTQTKVTIEDYMVGDVDGDDVVDLADAVLVINHYVGKPVGTFVEKAADVDGDSVIDLADAVKIINYYVGKVSSLSRRAMFDEKEPQ